VTAAAQPRGATARGRRRAQLSVRTKILGLVATFALVAITLGGVATVQLQRITADAAHLADTQATVGTSLTALKDSLWAVRNTITAIGAYPVEGKQAEVDELDAAYATLGEAQSTFVDAFTASHGAQPQSWQAFVDALAAYRGIVDGDLMDAALSGDQAQWAAVRDSGAAELGGVMVASLTEVEAEVATAMTAQAQASAKSGREAILATVVALAVGLLLCALVGLRMAGSVRASPRPQTW